jgi:hypothetical protein
MSGAIGATNKAPTGAILQSPVLRVKEDPVALLELSLEQKWGDGLPLIPPTDARVEAMLAATPRASTDIVLARMPPRDNVATVEMIAINAVMAGCAPRHLPLLIAAVEAVGGPSLDAAGHAATTAPVATMMVVNGPTRDEMGIDYRASCLGGAAGRGSVTLGRALQLCIRNIGGMRAGETTRSVHGQPARVSGLCFGEWEERSDWPTLAMRRGFKREQEVVTVHGGMGTSSLLDVNTLDDRELAQLIAKSLATPMGNLYQSTRTPGEVLIVINPMWAERFQKTWPKVESFQEFLHEHAWQPVDSWPKRLQEIFRDHDRVDGRGRIHAVTGPDRLQPLVAGGLGNLHLTVLPSWGASEMQSRATVRP